MKACALSIVAYMSFTPFCIVCCEAHRQPGMRLGFTIWSSTNETQDSRLYQNKGSIASYRLQLGPGEDLAGLWIAVFEAYFPAL